MRILLDACVWGGAKTELIRSGHMSYGRETGPKIRATTLSWRERIARGDCS